MPLTEGMILGIIGAALAAGGTATGMAMTGKLNKKNRKFQHDEAELARDFQAKQALESYNRQMEFYESTSSPAAQVSQYEKAGLNPALMYEGKMMSPQMPSPAVGSAPMAGAPASHGFPSDIMSGVLSAAKIGSEIRLMNSEADKNNADAGLSIQKIQESIKSMDVMDAKVEDLRASVQERMQNILQSQATVQEKAATVSMLFEKTNFLKVESERSQAVIEQIASSIKNMDADTENKEKLLLCIEQDLIRKQIENEALPDTLKTELQKMQSEISNIDAQTSNEDIKGILLRNENTFKNWENQYTKDTALKNKGFVRFCKGWNAIVGSVFSGSASVSFHHRSPNKR